MSEAVFARLPRFDRPATSGASKLRDLGARPVLVKEEGEAPEPAQPPKPQATEADLATKIQDVDRLLSTLAETIETTRADADRQARESIVELSGQLFPKLSRRFLAHEIEAHLGAMIPDGAAGVDIKANPALAEQLEDLINKSNRLSGLCTVQAEDSETGSRVDVSWKSGGLTFDFDGLLEACVGHLRQTHSVMEDKA